MKYYDDKTYQLAATMNKLCSALSYIALSFFIIGMIISKLIAIEMIFLFQYTYCGLLMLKKLETLMDPLKALWITNGFNIFVNDSQPIKLPPRVSQIFFKSEFIANFNFNFIVIILPFIIGSILYLIGKYRDS